MNKMERSSDEFIDIEFVKRCLDLATDRDSMEGCSSWDKKKPLKVWVALMEWTCISRLYKMIVETQGLWNKMSNTVLKGLSNDHSPELDLSSSSYLTNSMA